MTAWFTLVQDGSSVTKLRVHKTSTANQNRRATLSPGGVSPTATPSMTSQRGANPTFLP